MDWTEQRLGGLLNSVEENQHLDFKDGRFLKNNCQDDLTKQITGFANSDGGALIIGMQEGIGEKKHYAVAFSPCNGLDWSKETLESLIDSNISPRISGVKIYPIRLDNDVRRTVYVIEIPKSDSCHQASDSRYYFRLDFSTRPMKDFQIRDVMNRRKSTKLDLGVIIRDEEYLELGIRNMGLAPSKNWSLRIFIPEDSLELAEGFYGAHIISGINYDGIKEVNIDFGEVTEPMQLKFRGKRCYIFRQDRVRVDNSEIIFPRSFYRGSEIRLKKIEKEIFAAFWLIDADDGRRTYGVVTPTATETFVWDQSNVEGEQFNMI